jgi:hypothetical protein
MALILEKQTLSPFTQTYRLFQFLSQQTQHLFYRLFSLQHVSAAYADHHHMEITIF